MMRAGLLAGVAVGLAFGKNCLDGRFDLERLPSVIGQEGKPGLTPFPIRCDTVTVPKGAKTVVNAGVFLYFVKPGPANLIKVEGVLDLRGAKDHYVILAGGREAKTANLEPSKAQWAGILVEPGGNLEMEFTGVHGAPTPVTAFSSNVEIRNSFFTGGTGIVKPDGTLYELDPQFGAVNALDFSAPLPATAHARPDTAQKPAAVKTAKPARMGDTLSQEERDAILNRKRGFWSRPSTWLIGGGGIVAASLGYLALQPHPGENKGPANPALDTKPTFPPN